VEEKEKPAFVHQYTVDLIAEYKDRDEELVMHWALGKRSASEWARPEEIHLPKGTARFKDNIACQTVFEKNIVYPEFRTIQFIFKWIDQYEADKIIQTINFVVLERKRNIWFNNGGQNYQIVCALGALQPTSDLDAELLPLGRKLGEVIQNIVQCETVYESWTLMHRYFRCRDILKDKTDLNDPRFAIVLLVWLRYSFMRQLTWQKRYNTKPRELQHS
jgi:alpha-glucan, water dikinase